MNKTRNKILLILVVFLIVLTGCQDNKIEGYVLEIDEGGFLFAEDATEEEYIKWEGLTHNELIELTPGPRLIQIEYEQLSDLEAGNHIIIELDGEIAESYPAQAKAKKVKKLK